MYFSIYIKLLIFILKILLARFLLLSIQTCIQDRIHKVSEIKTLGWTISEWQTAYLKQEIQLDTLKELVAAIDPNDVSWQSWTYYCH